MTDGSDGTDRRDGADGTDASNDAGDGPEPGTFGAVLFDLGGVVIDLPSVRAGYVAFLTRFAEREGIEDVEAFADDWRSALGAYFSERDGTEYRTAREGYAVALEDALGREVAEEEWRPLFEEASAEHTEPTDGAVETLRALDDRGLFLGVVSDIDHAAAEDALDRFGVLECFDSLVTSERVGRTKPDPAMFAAALEDLPVDPSRALYVGDRYEHDMAGGSRAGLVTVAYGGSAAEQADPGGAVGERPDDASDGPRARRARDEHVGFVVDDLRGLLMLTDGRPP